MAVETQKRFQTPPKGDRNRMKGLLLATLSLVCVSVGASAENRETFVRTAEQKVKVLRAAATQTPQAPRFSESASELSETQIASIEKNARRDAETESDEKFWALATFAGSTFLGPYFSLPALGVSYYYQPAPPAHRLIGKSLRYTEIYTHTYKSVYRRASLRGVLIGGLGGSALYYYNRRYGFTFFRSW